MSLQERPTLRKVLAAFVASGIALVGILVFGGDEEADRKVVEELCASGLEAIAAKGGLDLCTHGPDPARPLTVKATTPEQNPNLFYRQSDLCPGDGRSGHRVYVYVGGTQGASAAPATFTTHVKQTLGLAERQMRQSHLTHASKINYYCEQDKVPTIRNVTFPEIGGDGRFTFDDMLATIGSTSEPGTHVAFPYGIDSAYPYCGEGTIGGFGDDVHFALIAPFCLAPSDTLLHELGHNFGAVAPEAPHDSGAWHCHDNNDVMCYNDGGSYFRGGTMITRCDKLAWRASNGTTYRLDRFDCNHDDYWNPVGELGWRNAAESPLLTAPRKR